MNYYQKQSLEQIKNDLLNVGSSIQKIILNLNTYLDNSVNSNNFFVITAKEYRMIFNYLFLEYIEDDNTIFTLDEVINFLSTVYEDNIDDLSSSGAISPNYYDAPHFRSLTRQEQRYRLLEMTINPFTYKTYRSRYDCFIFLGVDAENGNKTYKLLPKNVRIQLYENIVDGSNNFGSKNEIKRFIKSLLEINNLIQL